MSSLLTHYFPSLSTEKKEKLLHLIALYTEWNLKLNLISKKDAADTDTLLLKHILHSLTIAHFYPFPLNARVLDIGTGGGLPALPLAIFFPYTHFTLCDSIGKKINVVKKIVATLHLTNVICTVSRVENLPPLSFDYVTARGVAPLSHLVRWSIPLLRTPHSPHAMLFLKGGDITKECESIFLPTHLQAIQAFFKESFFEEKYIVCV